MSTDLPKDQHCRGRELLGTLGALVEASAQLLLPRRCVSCSVVVAGPRVFCPPCELTVEAIDHPCARCGQPGGDPVCTQCAARPIDLDGVLAPFIYGGALSAAIVRLKYHGLDDGAGPLGTLLACAVGQSLPRQKPCRLVPVPLHQRRLRQRGFNQATLLARKLSTRSGLDLCCAALTRRRDTAPQSRQSGYQARQQNVEGAFSASARHVSGRTIVLVDDVLTTGATAQACTRSLRGAGCTRVLVVALARTCEQDDQ